MGMIGFLQGFKRRTSQIFQPSAAKDPSPSSRRACTSL